MVYYLIRIPLLLKSREHGGGGWGVQGEGSKFTRDIRLVTWRRRRRKNSFWFKLRFSKRRRTHWGKDPPWHQPDGGNSAWCGRQQSLARVKSGRTVNGDLSSDGEAHLGSLLAAVTWLADCVPRILAVKHAISRHIDFAQGSLTRQPGDARCRQRGEEGRKGRARRKGDWKREGEGRAKKRAEKRR